jgi:hypothetical protein
MIHHVSDWTHHYPLGAIREHVWKEAGKAPKEIDTQPGFFDIAYKNTPFLKRVADLPIFGDKAELAQFDGAHKIVEIDIPEIAPRPKGHPAAKAKKACERRGGEFPNKNSECLRSKVDERHWILTWIAL